MTANTTEASLPMWRWDPLVRITHWGIVVAVIVNALVVEEGSAFHIWVGYGLAALLALRLLWGLIGPPEARFSAFPPNPSRAIAHVREIASGTHTTHASHNPLGALMVYAIWSCLTAIIATGIAMAPPSAAPWTNLEGKEHAETGVQAAAPVAAEREEGGETEERGERDESPLTEIHEIAVNLLYLLIALHLAGVIFEARRSGRQILTAMLPWPTGAKRA
ncbi:cytochrome b/b6 domain-containing protein [Flavisphingomonas formosensis]|uniref:cytochrome b/b6 domain-containing protein n=1 Tax=Flavisphingomonas formosensis TaxID=861534 RepID=UPI0012F8922A|nr:cytochrome b/b6 domain-containing protein [Sphingomonas formosensis]